MAKILEQFVDTQVQIRTVPKGTLVMVRNQPCMVNDGKAVNLRTGDTYGAFVECTLVPKGFKLTLEQE